MWQTNLFSKKLANTHFWLGTIGILFYALPMYVAAITQGLMWKEFTPDGLLQYPNFLSTTLQIIPMYMLRALGGLFYLSGVFVMVYNLIKTAKAGDFLANEAAEAPALEKKQSVAKEYWHRVWERKPVFFTILVTIAILLGGIFELVPSFLLKTKDITTITSVKPYSPLELEGRDIYISEGCVGCHSQMIRPFRSETERYGEYSKAGEFVYDHPFLWGSKRTGPDLHRVGQKYPDSWHYNHMYDPTSMSPGSIMPPYPWLFDTQFNIKGIPAKIEAMQTLGVPYPDGYAGRAIDDVQQQAMDIVNKLKKDGIKALPDQKIIALIAYLQRLGTDIKISAQNDTEAVPPTLQEGSK
jgi:cytochrome c oxidase cbb3-type subunit I/II